MKVRFLIGAALAIALGQSVSAQSSFVNWESPHVSPIDLTPDGARLLAVNTADNRLEVFSLSSGAPVHVGSVPVGLDPVSVRARSGSEAWVVNHISDSVSIVDLDTLRVTATITVGDEPADVIFAGTPARAFVSVSQLNLIRVYDPDTKAKIGDVAIEGEDPRALATDGANVYAAIFESGNRTTILPQTVVSSTLNPYPGDQNPPPNAGTSFEPPLAPTNPPAPAVSLIVKKIGNNWMDDNPSAPGNWNSAVTWNLHDHDVAVINANSLAVSYVSGTMNLNMHLAVSPAGNVAVVGTDATNHVRFEPNVSGTFVRVHGATFSIGGGSVSSIVDLNPHLNYDTSTVDQAQRDLSVGDPRGIAFNADGSLAYITGMGSNNLIVTNANLGRIADLEVGQGPTGLRFDTARNQIYVLNKFDATISVVNPDSLSESQTISLFDPTPSAIKVGRPHLYDTHRTSGLGQSSCASCHIDGRMDQLAWDLGNPAGLVEPNTEVCNFGLGGCENFHPMKGPMTTQTLIGIIGTEPFHWRGDRDALAAFNPAFIGLLGDDVMLTTQEMNEFTAFVATLRNPPNPNRTISNGLKTSMPTSTGVGNAVTGSTLYNTGNLDFVQCVTCHALPTGTNGQLTSGNLLQETQSIKIPQLRNMYDKGGFFATGPNAANSNRGFGFIHDGSVENLFAFLQFDGFNFAGGATGDQQRRDVEAFLLSFSTETFAGVGVQTTVVNFATIPAEQSSLIATMISLANSNSVGLVVKGRISGEARGWRYNAGTGAFQSDRSAETITSNGLLSLAAPGSELTYTMVSKGSETRIGIDRDLDGYFDADETDACANPADPQSIPGAFCLGDIAPQGKLDGMIDVDDLLLVINSWGSSGGNGPADIAPGCGNGVVDVDDLLAVINGWGACP